MSQYCRPDSVLTPSPVILVGALVLGRTTTSFLAGFFAGGAVWANANVAPSASVMRPATANLLITRLLIGHLRQGKQDSCSAPTQPAQSHQSQPAHPSAAEKLRRWTLQEARN